MTIAVMGQAFALVANSITLTFDSKQYKYWFIQNHSASNFMGIAIPGFLGVLRLNPINLVSYPTGGGAGDWIDSNRFPFFPDTFTLSSTDASAPFCAWPSVHPPNFPTQTQLYGSR